MQLASNWAHTKNPHAREPIVPRGARTRRRDRSAVARARACVLSRSFDSGFFYPAMLDAAAACVVAATGGVGGGPAAAAAVGIADEDGGGGGAATRDGWVTAACAAPAFSAAARF